MYQDIKIWIYLGRGLEVTSGQKPSIYSNSIERS